MKFLKVLAVLVAVLVAISLFLPSSSHVERSVVINAEPAVVFEQLNSFENFNKWSPWAQRDPAANYQYSGPSTGVGSVMSWHSERDDVGSGSQVITESQPPRYLAVALDFGDQGSALASYTLSDRSGATHITWAFDTELGWNPISRYFGLAMDGMLGPDYEAGLANLKALVESGSSQPAAPE